MIPKPVSEVLMERQSLGSGGSSTGPQLTEYWEQKPGSNQVPAIECIISWGRGMMWVDGDVIKYV